MAALSENLPAKNAKEVPLDILNEYKHILNQIESASDLDLSEFWYEPEHGPTNANVLLLRAKVEAARTYIDSTVDDPLTATIKQANALIEQANERRKDTPQA